MLVAQLFFIAAGVYLGNQADHWKEARDHRQAARATLAELPGRSGANRDRRRASTSELPSHADSMTSLAVRASRAGTVARGLLRRIRLQGLGPCDFRAHRVGPRAGDAVAQPTCRSDRRLRVADVYLRTGGDSGRSSRLVPGAIAVTNLQSLRRRTIVYPFLLTLAVYMERRRGPGAGSCIAAYASAAPAHRLGHRTTAEVTRGRRRPAPPPRDALPAIDPRRQFVSCASDAVPPSIAYASIGGQVHTRLRSPYALSMRADGGQNLCSRIHGAGNAACSRV